MKRMIFLIIFFLSTFSIHAQPEEKRLNALNNHFSIELPSTLDTMTSEQVKFKYNKTKNPNNFYYANSDLSFSFLLLVIAENITETDMIEHETEMLNGIKAKGFKIDTFETKNVDHHKIFILSFISSTSDERILNKRFLSVVENKLIMGAFNCPESESKKRLSQIDKSINSIQIK
jgi:hypothetical protein